MSGNGSPGKGQTDGIEGVGGWVMTFFGTWDFRVGKVGLLCNGPQSMGMDKDCMGLYVFVLFLRVFGSIRTRRNRV
jgi:hypothetical protein